jgi:hypothetical protein
MTLVRLDQHHCICGVFREEQFPCLHVAVAISKLGIPPTAFIHPTYSTSWLRATYQNSITPVCVDGLESDNTTLPPLVKKKAGRPRKIRIRSRGEVDHEDHHSCGNCGGKGHNKRTCARKK